MLSPTKRLQKNIDAKLREEQAGFRHGLSCNEQIFTLHNIIEQSLENRKLLIINCVDFKKDLIASIVLHYGRY